MTREEKRIAYFDARDRGLDVYAAALEAGIGGATAFKYEQDGRGVQAYSWYVLEARARREKARDLYREGWAKAEIARQIGVTPTAVGRYVQGIPKPEKIVCEIARSKGPKPLKITSEDIPAIVAARTAGESLEAIAQTYGVSREWVRKVCAVRDVKPRTPWAGWQYESAMDALAEGQDFYEVAKRFGIKATYLRQRAKLYRVECVGWRNRRGEQPSEYAPATIAKALELQKQGMSYQNIAFNLGVGSPMTVHRWVKNAAKRATR